MNVYASFFKAGKSWSFTRMTILKEVAVLFQDNKMAVHSQNARR